MREIKILVGRHYGFDTIHNTSIMLENIVSTLKEKFNVKIIWFCYLPEKISKLQNGDDIVVNIHDYNNAAEVLRDTKPDLIFDNEYPSLVDLSLDRAGNYLGIPVLTMMQGLDDQKFTKVQTIRTFIPLMFSDTIPSENKNSKKKFMKRGRFFLYKYKFLLKTYLATRMGLLQTIKYFFIVLKIHLSYQIPFIDIRFVNTMHLLGNEAIKKKMIAKGFPESKLIVTGNPIFDKIIKKYNVHKKYEKNDRIRILFVPKVYFEFGKWTKKERDIMVTKIIEKLSHYPEFDLKVKLHPSSHNFNDYEKLIHSINSDVKIYQKGAVEDFLDECDVVVSYSPLASSGIFPLLAKKPLILCNFINYKSLTVTPERVAIECVNPSDLISKVKNSFVEREKNKEKIEKHLEILLYKIDGKSSERASAVIERLLHK